LILDVAIVKSINASSRASVITTVADDSEGDKQLSSTDLES
jgi:hypothetical protein